MFIVMMPNSWGRGETIAAAEKIAREQGRHGRKKVKRLCWKYDPAKTPTVYISDVGNLCWEGDKPERVDLE